MTPTSVSLPWERSRPMLLPSAATTTDNAFFHCVVSFHTLFGPGIQLIAHANSTHSFSTSISLFNFPSSPLVFFVRYVWMLTGCSLTHSQWLFLSMSTIGRSTFIAALTTISLYTIIIFAATTRVVIVVMYPLMQFVTSWMLIQCGTSASNSAGWTSDEVSKSFFWETSSPLSLLNVTLLCSIQFWLTGTGFISFFFCSFFLYSTSSAKCISVQKPHTNLPDTPVALTSASKYFQMLPGPPGALQCALRLCNSILRCTWKHQQLWRCIQDATGMTIKLVSVSSWWDLGADQWETLRVAETSAQVCRRLWEQPRPLLKHCRSFRPVSSQQWFLGFHNHKAFRLSYFSLLQWKALLHHNMAWIV